MGRVFRSTMVFAASASLTFSLLLWTVSGQDMFQSLRGTQQDAQATPALAEATGAAMNTSSAINYAAFIQTLNTTMTSEDRDVILFESLVALGNQAQSSSADACNSGLLGYAVKKYPSATNCLAPCHGSCSAVNAIMGGYMTRGGQPGAMKVACQRAGELDCLFNHIGPCMEFVDKAKGFGLSIPTSREQLRNECR